MYYMTQNVEGQLKLAIVILLINNQIHAYHVNIVLRSIFFGIVTVPL